MRGVGGVGVPQDGPPAVSPFEKEMASSSLSDGFVFTDFLLHWVKKTRFSRVRKLLSGVTQSIIFLVTCAERIQRIVL